MQSTDDPLPQLFNAELLARCRRAIEVHQAMVEAFKERTGDEFKPDSDYTLEDVRRADRILKAGGHRGIGSRPGEV